MSFLVVLHFIIVGAMPTLVVGMRFAKKLHNMPTTSVGMAPYESNDFLKSPVGNPSYFFPTAINCSLVDM
jgi:hypothetical protein